MKEIKLDELKTIIDSEIILINIDLNSEFNKKYLPNSRNIPFKSENFKEILIESIPKNSNLVIYGNNKEEIKEACSLITHLGFKVNAFCEGVDSWENDGLPVMSIKEN